MSIIQLRAKCECGCDTGRITETGNQDVVRCSWCEKFQYNAPRHETGKAIRPVSQRENISPSMRSKIMLRAGGACELCHSSDYPLTVGHLLSVVSGTELGVPIDTINGEENLSAMCESCNSGLGKETVPLRIAVSIVMARSRNNRSMVNQCNRSK